MCIYLKFLLFIKLIHTNGRTLKNFTPKYGLNMVSDGPNRIKDNKP